MNAAVLDTILREGPSGNSSRDGQVLKRVRFEDEVDAHTQDLVCSGIAPSPSRSEWTVAVLLSTVLPVVSEKKRRSKSCLKRPSVGEPEVRRLVYKRRTPFKTVIKKVVECIAGLTLDAQEWHIGYQRYISLYAHCTQAEASRLADLVQGRITACKALNCF